MFATDVKPSLVIIFGILPFNHGMCSLGPGLTRKHCWENVVADAEKKTRNVLQQLSLHEVRKYF